MTSTIITIVRILLGLFFIVFGLNYWFQYIQTPPPPTDDAGAFLGLLAGSGYLAAVKVLEVAGGLALLLKRTCIGLLLLGPVIINILLYDIFLAEAANPMVIVAAVLALVLLFYKGRRFAPLLRAD